VADGAVEVDRRTALGARRVEAFEGWTTMQDPEGNEFCVAVADDETASLPGTV
jgi:hypothetical protein